MDVVAALSWLLVLAGVVVGLLVLRRLFRVPPEVRYGYPVTVSCAGRLCAGCGSPRVDCAAVAWPPRSPLRWDGDDS